MKCELQDSVIRLATGISGGEVDLNKVLLLGIGTLLAQPQNDIKVLGELEEVTYCKNGVSYTHQFHNRPKLAHSLTSLFILNGKFNVRECGIVEVEDIENRQA